MSLQETLFIFLEFLKNVSLRDTSNLNSKLLKVFIQKTLFGVKFSNFLKVSLIKTLLLEDTFL